MIPEGTIRTDYVNNDFIQKYVFKNGKWINGGQFFHDHDGSLYTKYTKDEINQMIDVYNPLTFLPFLEELDFPYIRYEWQKLVKRYVEEKGPSYRIFGRYLSKMKLCSFKNYTYKDNDQLNSYN